MMYYNRIASLLIILVIISVSCNSGDRNNQALSVGSIVSGKVVSIIDGDTYDVLFSGNNTASGYSGDTDPPFRSY